MRTDAIQIDLSEVLEASDFSKTSELSLSKYK